MQSVERHPDDLLTVNDVADQYRIGRHSVRSFVRSGELRAVRIGARILIPRWEVVRWIEAQLDASPDQVPLPQSGVAA